MKPFADRLIEAVRRCGNPVLVGLDPRVESLPRGLQPSDPKNPIEVANCYGRFCCRVIEVVAPLVPIVKPQAAFFEQLGPHGMSALRNVIDYARRRGLLVILDGKRNDIGSTAEAYAAGYLGPPELSAWGADSLTISPYLGGDSLEPFVQVARDRGAGVFVLVKTSNPGGGLFQDLIVADGEPLHRHVARHVESLAADSQGAGGYGAVGAVVGATYPRQLAELRSLMPHAWFLVPGFGAQGGTAADVAAAFDDSGLGAVVNNSRGIIFAHSSKEYREKFGDSRWQEAVEAATVEMIEQLRTYTPAGRLRQQSAG